MRVDKLKEYINHYKRFLEKSPDYEIGYKWAANKQFKDNWKLLFTDFPKMYDASISDRFVQRFWGNRYEHPKAAMLKLVAYQPEQAESMFRALLNEDELLERRIGKFLFMLDDLLSDYKRTHEDLNNHLHDGFKMISVYLSFQYPEKYPLFDYKVFSELMRKLGATNIPQINEFDRYIKVLKNINLFIQKDEELLAIHKKRIVQPDFFQEDSLLLAQDFVWCCGNAECRIEHY